MITASAPPQPRLAFARWQLASAVTLLFVAGLGLAPASTFALSGVAMKALCAKLPAGSGDMAAAARHKTAGDAAFAARIELASAKAAIQSYRASIAANPKQPRVLLRLSRAWYLLGDGHYRFEEDDDAQLDAFLQGGNAAAAAVALTAPRFKSLICSGAAESDAIATLDARAIPALYWFATNLGKYGLAKDLIELLANKDMIFGVMSRARLIAPRYFNYAPDRYLGAYFTKVPFPKGDLPRALKHFQATMRGNRDYLATYVLVAQMYALKIKDRVPDDAKYCKIGSPIDDKATQDPCRRLFQRLLNHVLKTPAKILPKIEAEQRVEQEKAKRLLEELDTYFPKK
jgi:hypothetical protein